MKKRKINIIISLIVLELLSWTSYAKSQLVTEKWEYTSSYSKSYFLERKWLSDTVYTDRYFFDNSSEFLSDTFYLRQNESYFKRGSTYYSYLAPSSFERGDTIQYFYQEPVNTTGNLYMIRDFYYPDKKIQAGNGVLVYILVSPFDDPKYSTSRVYFDSKRNLITKITSIDGELKLKEN